MVESNPIWNDLFHLAGKSLTCGQPQRDHLATLEALEKNPALLGGPIRNKSMALCCVGALWLKADYFDRSHQIFQEIHDPTGSLWHGISHRREGDFSNAGYWFSRCGLHPSGVFLARKLAESKVQGYPPNLIQSDSWDFKVLNRLAEIENDRNSPSPLTLQLQDLEWESLFLWTLNQATS
jgi:hypothetical protein